jgi:hypothetical protein
VAGVKVGVFEADVTRFMVFLVTVVFPGLNPVMDGDGDR